MTRRLCEEDNVEENGECRRKLLAVATSIFPEQAEANDQAGQRVGPARTRGVRQEATISSTDIFVHAPSGHRHRHRCQARSVDTHTGAHVAAKLLR